MSTVSTLQPAHQVVIQELHGISSATSNEAKLHINVLLTVLEKSAIPPQDLQYCLLWLRKTHTYLHHGRRKLAGIILRLERELEEHLR
jgi:hypothetical protein